MRRILIEQARRKRTERHGGGRERREIAADIPAPGPSPDQLLAVDEALTRLAAEDATAAELVKLRYFAGLSVEDAGEMLGLSRPTAYRQWVYARSWLRCEIVGDAAAET